jgi:hypothetical protein
MIRIFHNNSLSVLVYGDSTRTTRSPEDAQILIIETPKGFWDGDDLSPFFRNSLV